LIFLVLSRPTEEPWPLDHRDSMKTTKLTQVVLAENERALLNLFLAKINKIDPDVIVGHDIASYDLDILLHRFTQNKVDQWSRLGRLRRNNMPMSKVCLNISLLQKFESFKFSSFKGYQSQSSCHEWAFGL
jgi:DNA polymerase elongation subunit (family B)